jgi:hypothetical protein
VHPTTVRDVVTGVRAEVASVVVGCCVREGVPGADVTARGGGNWVVDVVRGGTAALGGISAGELGGAVSNEIPGPAGSTGAGSGGR